MKKNMLTSAPASGCRRERSNRSGQSVAEQRPVAAADAALAKLRLFTEAALIQARRQKDCCEAEGMVALFHFNHGMVAALVGVLEEIDGSKTQEPRGGNTDSATTGRISKP